VSHVSLSSEVNLNLLERCDKGDIQAFVVAYRKGGVSESIKSILNNSWFLAFLYSPASPSSLPSITNIVLQKMAEKQDSRHLLSLPSEKKRERID